jgi:hypothetical protein
MMFEFRSFMISPLNAIVSIFVTDSTEMGLDCGQ